MKTTYEILAANRWRTVLLLLLFPVMIGTITLLGSFAIGFAGAEQPNEAMIIATDYFLFFLPFVTIGSLIWIVIAFLGGRNMILAFAGAKPIEKRDHPELYRTVENIAIQTGIPVPQIYIIEDQSLNAFATGYSPEKAAVAITRGLLTKLDKTELEAVMAHEFGHILHRDIRVMLIAVTMVGIVQLLSEIVLRSMFHGMIRSGGGRGGNRKGGAGIFILIGLAIWLIGFIGAIFVQMAISRRREFMADAQSAHLTRHPDSLIGALRKISADPRVEGLDGKRTIAAMCIIDPLEREKRGFFESLMGLFATHPHVEDRIAALRAMGGQS